MVFSWRLRVKNQWPYLAIMHGESQTRRLGSIIEPDVFVAAVLRALARGEIAVVIPRRFRAIVLLRTLPPRLIGRGLAWVKLRALPNRPS